MKSPDPAVTNGSGVTTDASNVVQLHGKPGHNSKAAMRAETQALIKQKEDEVAGRLKPVVDDYVKACAAVDAVDKDIQAAREKAQKLESSAQAKGEKLVETAAKGRDAAQAKATAALEALRPVLLDASKLYPGEAGRKAFRAYVNERFPGFGGERAIYLLSSFNNGTDPWEAVDKQKTGARDRKRKERGRFSAETMQAAEAAGLDLDQIRNDARDKFMAQQPDEEEETEPEQKHKVAGKAQLMAAADYIINLVEPSTNAIVDIDDFDIELFDRMKLACEAWRALYDGFGDLFLVPGNREALTKKDVPAATAVQLKSYNVVYKQICERVVNEEAEAAAYKVAHKERVKQIHAAGVEAMEKALAAKGIEASYA
jgi:hypothetical protein